MLAMFAARRGVRWLIAAAALSLVTMFYTFSGDTSGNWLGDNLKAVSGADSSQWRVPDDYFWKQVPTHYPPSSVRSLPSGRARSFPKVQATKFPQTPKQRDNRVFHRKAVKQAFKKCWQAYRERAWLADELTPISGESRNTFGGWGATLVDSLDTLWIMGLKDEFAEAVDAAVKIDFTKSEHDVINVFETTIRYLGGFLGAYDLSGDARLLRKANEVGEMLLKAFDTPNRMPITRWRVNSAGVADEKQEAADNVLVAEIGSLTMEFTRLSLLTGDPKWFDAVQRITDIFYKQQMTTSLAGMWPLAVNAKDEVFNQGSHFTLGAMADSLYEYLPKMSALLAGKLPEYQEMYERAMDVASDWLLFRPMTPTDDDILISGHVEVRQEGGTLITPKREGQHLACFVGGMYALGGKLYGRKDDVDIARKLTEGCIWTYKASPHGVMPETLHLASCKSKDTCTWDGMEWKKQVLHTAGEGATGDFEADVGRADAIISEKRLPEGFTDVPDGRYILRPEAIESVFILYRVTGRADLLDTAWEMFTAISKVTSRHFGNTAVADVMIPDRPAGTDSMESFWMGETLKYFYLIFSDPGLVSLDDFVFNTEAHPFRRLKR